MPELILRGIPGSNPIGAMAAFGLFRIIAREQPFGEVRLAWQFEADWRPVLHTAQAIKMDNLIQFLIDRQPKRTDAPFLTWNDDIKCDPEDVFAKAVKQERDAWHSSQRDERDERQEVLEFFCAYGCNAITAKSTSDVKPTTFHMTAGQQRFLKAAREVSASLDLKVRSSKRQSEKQRREELIDVWSETLCGPWHYRDTEHSLGWDPTTEGLYALSDRSPSAAGPRSVRGAVWLAFESLALFPSVPGKRKLLTTGFSADGDAFYWPIWELPITLSSLRALIGLPDLVEGHRDLEEWHRRGICAVFKAQCLRDGNGRGTFRNAIEIH